MYSVANQLPFKRKRKKRKSKRLFLLDFQDLLKDVMPPPASNWENQRHVCCLKDVLEEDEKA